jgi:hypothetical protein
MEESAQDGGSRSGGLLETDRQLLFLIATGFSSMEAGDLLGFDLCALRSKLRLIREHLGVISTAAAVKVFRRSME